MSWLPPSARISYFRQHAHSSALLVGLLAAAAVQAEPVDYARDVRPLLRNKCVSCHGSVRQEAGLRLDAGSLLLRGGDGGPVVAVGESADSLLIERVTADDEQERMPPTGAPLSLDQVQMLRSWIDAGASYPSDERIVPTPGEHWAFQAVRRRPPPPVQDDRWPRNAVDNFVLAKLEARGWRPAEAAKPASLLRRAHLDLLGIPPSPAEQDAFLASCSPDAYERLVRELLGRPDYGERFARHWLDVVRYADSNGYERDGAKPEVWRYRDYVIRAFNADKPFDRFVLEQLAGDELPDADTDSVLATGFCRLGPWDDEPADVDVDRFDQLDDMINTTSQTFLALTMGCARCHDHKFDPLTQAEYYRLLAVFQPLERPREGRTELARYAAPPARAALLAERDRRIQQLEFEKQAMRRDFQREFLSQDRSRLPPSVKLAFLTDEQERDSQQNEQVRENQAWLDAEIDPQLPAGLIRRMRELEARIAELRAATPGAPPGYFLFESGPRPKPTHVLLRGNPHRPGEPVAPGVPAVLVASQPEFLSPDKFTSRRRLSLARWIVDHANPLTARVIVNRVWQWHFGEGLVRTPNDFGLLGAPPTHPELLDYLADWFVHDGAWSLKRLHYLIMTSRTYQMSCDGRGDYAELDPENRWLWRRSRRRLEVEAIRDSMLWVSGRLNRQMHGPAMYPFVPREALLSHADKTSIWPAFDESSASRRTVYAFIKRSMVVPMLEVLDLCDTARSSPQRAVTTVPTQALTLYNGDFVNRQARRLAERLERQAGNDLTAQIELAWRLALCRRPSPSEMVGVREFVAGELGLDPEAVDAVNVAQRRQALRQVARVVFNLNEFVYPN